MVMAFVSACGSNSAVTGLLGYAVRHWAFDVLMALTLG